MINNPTVYCEVCRKFIAKINTKRGLVCWDCYQVELKIFKNQDWRDTKIDNYLKNNDLTQREGESKTNLANRCKLILAKQGFIFE